MLDTATPGFCALLWLGTLPPPEVMVLGLITAFAGYTAVYALNDVVDCRIDQEKLRLNKFNKTFQDVDAVYVRHPIAQGYLSLADGLAWIMAWALLALIGSYLLNPVCTIIFLLAAFLEVIYCLLLRITYLRAIVSGVVKTSGGIAAVFAVDPQPDPLFLILLFLWLFFWEIGGQNIPNDWIDLKEDRLLQARTVPIRFEDHGSSTIILAALVITLALSTVLLWTAPIRSRPLCFIAVSLCGIISLLLPALRLHKTKDSRHASVLFNSASFYPLSILAVITACLLL